MSAGSGGGGEARAESHHAGAPLGANTWLQLQFEARNLISCQLWEGVDRPIFEMAGFLGFLPIYRSPASRGKISIYEGDGAPLV